MNATKLGSLLFILLIAVVFTLQFGPGSSGCGRLTTGDPNAVAVVNGKEIGSHDFRNAYRGQIFRLRQMGIPENQARLFGLPQQTLNGLVDSTLLAQAAERQGIVPTDDEVRKQLFQLEMFQIEGRFNAQHYRQQVQQRYGKTPQAFEAQIRSEIAAQRLLSLVEESAAVSEAEVKQRYFREKDQAELAYVRFVPAQFAAKVKPATDAELATFREQHAAEIQADYDQNQFVYQQPERVKARQILVKFPPNATDDQKAEAKEKLAAIRKELQGGADFAEVAKRSSEDLGSKANGGDIGWVERGGWDPALADATFPLAPGEVTEPVETRIGYQLVKVEEKQAPKRRELAEVQDEIARKLWTRERSKDLAKQAAEGALAQASTSGKTLAELYPKAAEQADAPANPFAPPEAQKAEVSEVQSFSVHTEFVPGLGPAPELVGAVRAVENAPTVLNQVFNVGEGFVIAQVTGRQRATEEAYGEQREVMREEALNAKKYELRDQYVKALREQSQVQTYQDAVDRLLGQG